MNSNEFLFIRINWQLEKSSSDIGYIKFIVTHLQIIELWQELIKNFRLRILLRANFRVLNTITIIVICLGLKHLRNDTKEIIWMEICCIIRIWIPTNHINENMLEIKSPLNTSQRRCQDPKYWRFLKNRNHSTKIPND